MAPVEEEHRATKDRAWHVALLSAVMAFFALSSNRSGGYFYVMLMDELHVDRGAASWPVFLLGTMIDIGGTFAGPLARRYSISSVMVCGAVLYSTGILCSVFAPTIAWYTVTLGLIHGMGAGILYTMLQVILSMNFEKYRGTAHGIMYIGSSLSVLVGPKLLFFLQRTYNFRKSVVLFGSLLLNTIPCSLLFRFLPYGSTKKYEKRNKKPMTVFSVCESGAMAERGRIDANQIAKEEISLLRAMQSVLRLPVYYVIVMSWLVCCYMMEIFIATVIDYVIDKGASQSDAVSVMSYSSLADLLGRALLPVLTDRNVLRRSSLTACTFFVMGAALTCMPLAASYGAIVAVTFAASCSGGCAMCMCGVLLPDYVDLDKLEVSYGLMGMIVAPLFLVRPFFVGFFRDTLGTYDDMYHILAGIIFFTCLLWCLVACTEQRTSKRYVLRTDNPLGAAAK